MLTKNRLFLFIFAFISFSFTAFSQFNDYSLKLGARFHGLLPDTEFEKELKVASADFKFSYMGSLFLRFELIKQFIETEFSATYGQLAGVDFKNNEYRTDIIPIDLKFIVSPFNLNMINPYAYAGIGVLRYEVKKFPQSESPNKKNLRKSDWSPFLPIGGGIEFSLSDYFLLDVNVSYTFAFTDNLNYYNNLDAYPGISNVSDGYYSAGLGLTYVIGSGNTDEDMDGLIKKEEKNLGTDPKNPDTDGDGLKDGEEVNLYKTNPLNADTDGDGLPDGEEIFKYKTNPLDQDSDGDGLKDGEEVNLYKTNPAKADTDGDGLSDYEELFNFKTDPLKADTDGEGLSDGDEVLKYKTDPLKIDSDGDGLYDGEEILKYKTDPLRKDTDMGGVDDLTELTRGTNPLDADDDVVKVGVPIILEGVTFETGKADITPESAQVLRGALKTLTTYPDIVVEIGGHTDNVGSKNSNIRLSQRRADSVRNWLIERGIDPNRITSKGYGPDQPIAPNDTPENKRKNRRIEFKRIK